LAASNTSVVGGPFPLSGGNANLVLKAPLNAGNSVTGTVDVAINLGATTTDQSCLASHGGTAGNMGWLRAQNGNCAATFDRDPTARATFGVYAPETRRTIHVREQF
jgi:MSHA biogenesis protein MshQ